MERIEFKINGVQYSVGSEVDSNLTLLDFIRTKANLLGTKYMCLEAGCGACIVSVVKTPGSVPVSINTCMVIILSCHNWEITTIEKLGNRLDGYHPIQETLAKYNGTQCGHCSPGWVMSMYSLLERRKDYTMLEIEKSFDSNICRCTGYRSILDAFKTFAKDAPKSDINDIEDLHICKKDRTVCTKRISDDNNEDWSIINKNDVEGLNVQEIQLKDGKCWYKAEEISDIFTILEETGDDSYMLVAGNTAKGVYPIAQYPRVLIDISNISGLKGFKIDQNLIIRAGNTLTELLYIFELLYQREEYFAYLKPLHEHLTRVAHIAVRNLGTIGGNLMIKHQHNEFPSDVYLLLETVGAAITIMHAANVREVVTMEQFLKIDMKGKVILNVLLPPFNAQCKVVTFKSLLFLCPEQNINLRIRSGATRLNELRPLSKGQQSYETKPSLYPLTQPIPKIEALIQCAGEATYTEDQLTSTKDVFAALVLSTVPIGTIVSIDPSEALKQPGAIAFYSAKDIPGLNSFTPIDDPAGKINEKVFSTGEISYYNQPIGVIVAETKPIAELIAKMVKVEYTNIKKPTVDVREAKKDPKRNSLYEKRDATDKGYDIVKTAKGSFTSRGQNFFTLENVVCITRPTEEGFEVFATTQWMDGVQEMISKSLNIQQNKVDVYVRRLGGAFGLKVSRATLVAVVCSLVSFKLNRPCRFNMPLTNITRVFGKRFPCSSDYEAAVNSKGVIQYLNLNMYEDNGFEINENMQQFALANYNNCYDASRWNYKNITTVTDTAKNTWFRAPGHLENVAIVEEIMERISYEISLDPIEVRLGNLDKSTASDVLEIVKTLKTSSQYETRKAEVLKFNEENRWKKRGLGTCLMRWSDNSPRKFDVNLSVFHGDGSVIITHGGIEMGQGINTKAVQICAYLLKIPLDKIQIKANSTIVAPNVTVSGGSLTTQYITMGVQQCCLELLKRLSPIKTKLNNPTWEELIQEAFKMDVDLQIHGYVGEKGKQDYFLFGMTVAEVEIDVLTGENQVLRVDILEDVGQSPSPEIDIGQVEGAFVMGMGYWLTENLVYDSNTGELLTDRTWNYHVPQARDIPVDFRISFRKNSYSNAAIFGSKLVSEPPICMAVSVPHAIRQALTSARLDSGVSCWFEFHGTYTLEQICLAANNKISDYKFT